jgi:hypothetical protein
LTKRSYEKEKNLPNKNFKFTNSNGKEFGENKSILSDVGSSIINKFVTDNMRKLELMHEKEQEYETIRKTKPDPFINPWKFSNHIIGEFSTIPADKVHSFRQEKKPKYLIEKPFRIPSIHGNYLEKDLKII